jgi:soluble lytic murein transglycosylase
MVKLPENLTPNLRASFNKVQIAQSKLPWILGGGALIFGAGVATVSGLMGWWAVPFQSPLSAIAPSNANDLRNQLVGLDGPKRLAQLERFTKGPENQNKYRARYLLAQEQLKANQPQLALKALEGLEGQYKDLAPWVLLTRAQAQQKAGLDSKPTYQTLVQQFPSSPVSADGLIALGQADRAVATFPSAPGTLRYLDKALSAKTTKSGPQQLTGLLAVAQYGLHLPNYAALLDSLTQKYGAQLTPQQWDTVAFGYWEKQTYKKAGLAYAKAPKSSKTAYRHGRGLQLGGEKALNIFTNFVSAYPNAEETPLGLLRVSRLSDQTKAIPYLDQLLSRFPKAPEAAEAMADKATILEKTLKNTAAATQVRQQLLETYSSSEFAAELRWKQAREAAKTGNLTAASQWANAIAQNNPDSDLAPRALFWLGRWSAQQGQAQQGNQYLNQVLSRYPDSYYAWRSAVLLGWPVGDFTTVREFIPQLEHRFIRADLPAGSAAVQELYRIGQDQAAWELWNSEFANRQTPTVAEQYTDGVLRLGVGDYLDGMYMMGALALRTKPEEKQQYQALRKTLPYWQSLYPFPYQDLIEANAQANRLNPLLITALMRQESRFMPKIVSSAEAVGLMQVIPETSAMMAQKLGMKQYKMDQPADNIKIGTAYLDLTHNEFNQNSMLAVASYNAGPNAVAGWLNRDIKDPDAFVEAIPYPETEGYVRSVFGNYWNYLRLYNRDIAQRLTQVSPVQPK